MKSGHIEDMYRDLSEEEAPRRRLGLFRFAGSLVLAAFALVACGDDDDPGPDDDTRTATATATGADTATATATGGPTDPNTFTATGPANGT